jgi:electron transfer flavoprotein alpha subunit
MLRIEIEACIGCGACEEVCTFGAIEVVDGVAEVNEKCTLCGSSRRKLHRQTWLSGQAL